MKLRQRSTRETLISMSFASGPGGSPSGMCMSFVLLPCAREDHLGVRSREPLDESLLGNDEIRREDQLYPSRSECWPMKSTSTPRRAAVEYQSSATAEAE